MPLINRAEVHSVKYGPSFFPSSYGPSAKCAGHKSTGKNEDLYFFSTDREKEVNKIFITFLILEKRNHFKSIAATFERCVRKKQDESEFYWLSRMSCRDVNPNQTFSFYELLSVVNWIPFKITLKTILK